MASIQKRTRNGKTTYRVQYRDPSGAMRGKVFDRKEDARRFKTETEHAKDHQAWTDPGPARRPYADTVTRAWPSRPLTRQPVRPSRSGFGCTSTRTSATTRWRRSGRVSSRHGRAGSSSSSRRATSASCSPT